MVITTIVTDKIQERSLVIKKEMRRLTRAGGSDSNGKLRDLP